MFILILLVTSRICERSEAKTGSATVKAYKAKIILKAIFVKNLSSHHHFERKASLLFAQSCPILFLTMPCISAGLL